MCFFDAMGYFSRGINKAESFIFRACRKYYLSADVHVPAGLKLQYRADDLWQSVTLTRQFTFSESYCSLYTSFYTSQYFH